VQEQAATTRALRPGGAEKIRTLLKLREDELKKLQRSDERRLLLARELEPSASDGGAIEATAGARRNPAAPDQGARAPRGIGGESDTVRAAEEKNDLIRCSPSAGRAADDIKSRDEKVARTRGSERAKGAVERGRRRKGLNDKLTVRTPARPAGKGARRVCRSWRKPADHRQGRRAEGSEAAGSRSRTARPRPCTSASPSSRDLAKARDAASVIGGKLIPARRR